MTKLTPEEFATAKRFEAANDTANHVMRMAIHESNRILMSINTEQKQFNKMLQEKYKLKTDVQYKIEDSGELVEVEEE